MQKQIKASHPRCNIGRFLLARSHRLDPLSEWLPMTILLDWLTAVNLVWKLLNILRLQFVVFWRHMLHFLASNIFNLKGDLATSFAKSWGFYGVLLSVTCIQVSIRCRAFVASRNAARLQHLG